MQIKDLIPRRLEDWGLGSWGLNPWGRKSDRPGTEPPTGADQPGRGQVEPSLAETSLPATSGAAAGRHPMDGLRREVNRLFDDFWHRLDHGAAGTGPALGMGLPSADVAETENAIEVSLELPGLDEKDVEVSLSGDVLTIRGEKKAEREETHKGLYLSERRYGAFYRAIPIPAGVDAEKVTASFRKGVLTVTLPRTEATQTKARRIDVAAA